MPETSKPTLIVNARLVNEGREFEGDLRIENGRIAQIGSGLSAREGEHVVDAAGRRVLPGMIDDQVHFREPGMEYKADMATESAAAVAGGLTSFMDMPNTNPPTLDSAALEDKYSRATGRAWANFGFYMGASNDNLEAIRALDPLRAPGIKVFMGASTGNMLVDNPETLDAIFRDAPDADHHALRRHADDRRRTREVQGEVRRRHPRRIPCRHPFAPSVHEVDAAGAGTRPPQRRPPARAAHLHRRRTGVVRTRPADPRRRHRASASRPRPASISCASIAPITRRSGT